jgi:hypothetical protein
MAAVELVETLHRLFPDAVIKPSEPFEDEDVCLTVYGRWEAEALQRVRNRIYQLEFDLYDKYEVEAIVKVLPLMYLPNLE